MGGIYKTMCKVDMDNFRYDKRRCSLIFGLDTYTTQEVNLTSRSSVLNLDFYMRNGLIEVTGTDARRLEFSFDCCPNERYASIAYAVNMKRKTHHYTIAIVIPTVLTSALLPTLFICPREHRVKIGIIIVLSLRLISAHTPESDSTPWLRSLLALDMTVTTLAMVIMICILKMHDRHGRPLPQFVRKMSDGLYSRVFHECTF